MRKFFSRLLAMLLLACILLGQILPIAAAMSMDSYAYFAQPEQYSGYIYVPYRGYMRYYAQNDPLWRTLIYERYDSPQERVFGDGACNPTAFAMAIANFVPEEYLINIANYALRPFSLCPCSVNKARCGYYHNPRYTLTTTEDFARFLPLVFGDFAMGNNVFDVVSRGAEYGTDVLYVPYIAYVYGLTLTTTEDYNTAIQAMLNGDMVVGFAGAGGCLTNHGHFQVFAAIDEERLYMLDSYYRTEYNANYGYKVEIIQPGLVALTHENVVYAYFLNYFIFHRDW